jgi:hypothetical protein
MIEEGVESESEVEGRGEGEVKDNAMRKKTKRGIRLPRLTIERRLWPDQMRSCISPGILFYHHSQTVHNHFDLNSRFNTPLPARLYPIWTFTALQHFNRSCSLIVARSSPYIQTLWYVPNSTRFYRWLRRCSRCWTECTRSWLD